MVHKVAVIKVEDDVDNAVNRAIDLVGGFSPLDGVTIAIKPNLCSVHLLMQG